MDKKQTAEAIKVMQAFVDGKTIEWRAKGKPCLNWREHNVLAWDWFSIEYRIKPEVIAHRRYLYRDGPQGLYCVHTTTSSEALGMKKEVQVECVEKHKGFIRWIDKDWIEETV